MNFHLKSCGSLTIDFNFLLEKINKKIRIKLSQHDWASKEWIFSKHLWFWRENKTRIAVYDIESSKYQLVQHEFASPNRAISRENLKFSKEKRRVFHGINKFWMNRWILNFLLPYRLSSQMWKYLISRQTNWQADDSMSLLTQITFDWFRMF